MSSDQGLGGPLKKPAAKGLDGKPMGAKPLAGKALGDGAAAMPAAPAAPAAPLAFEFDDAPAPEPKTAKAPAPAAGFNPFDQPVDTRAPASAPAKPEQPVTGRVEKPVTSRVERPATGRTAKAAADDAGIGDIAPGLAKDLWLCPHCGAKNKPNRESCRECRKLPGDPVEKPWFKNPVIAGPVAGGAVLLVLLVMWLTSVDLGLHAAGTVDAKVRSAATTHEELDLPEGRHFSVKRTAAVSGRVITATDYLVAPWLTAVVVGLGSKATDDAEFSTWSAEFDGEGYAVKAPRHATLFLYFSDGKPAIKAGDYISVVGKAGVAAQDSTIVKGSDGPDCWAIKVEQFESR
jgi:hypothetical protein